LSSQSERLDIELVIRGLARSRNHAHQLIDQNRILIDGKPATKPAQKILEGQRVELSAGIDYVSRAGQKLLWALEQFEIRPSGVVIDAGASTGGFTQVLLEHGAAQVVAIDVGTDQLDPELRTDPRVVSLEGVNLRYLEPKDLAVLLADRGFAEEATSRTEEETSRAEAATSRSLPKFSLVVADLSFISLTLVLDALHKLAPEADMVLLIKPQFEVGKQSLKAGIVTDAPERERAIWQVVDAASALGYQVDGLIESPTTGTHGNVEYLLWITHTGVDNRQEWEQIIADRARRIT
jgi:23S rRNA (cytidine1920-2'-O)/16S rRNA (cytidine1409-2'-O)-methyltransferase